MKSVLGRGKEEGGAGREGGINSFLPMKIQRREVRTDPGAASPGCLCCEKLAARSSLPRGEPSDLRLAPLQGVPAPTCPPASPPSSSRGFPQHPPSLPSSLPLSPPATARPFAASSLSLPREAEARGAGRALRPGAQRARCLRALCAVPLGCRRAWKQNRDGEGGFWGSRTPPATSLEASPDDACAQEAFLRSLL